MKKRIAAMMLSVVLALCLLAGCRSKGISDGGAEKESLGHKGAMENFTAGTTFKATEPMTFTMLNRDHPSYPINREWRFWDDLEKITNVTFNMTDVPNAEQQQMFNLLMSSGEAPEILPRVNFGWGNSFVASGALLNIGNYLDYMPNFQQRIKDWGLEDELDTYRDVDGNLYFLPGLYEKVWHNHGLLIRTDILEELNLEMPDTWDEMYAVLKAMKEAYPDSWPFSDSNTLNGTLNHAAAAFGVQAGWGLANGNAVGVIYNWDKEEFIFTPVTNDMREFLTFFNRLYEEGLMDPESLTQENDLANQKFVNGKSFMMTGNAVLRDDFRSQMNQVLGEGKYSIGRAMIPGGPAGKVVRGLRANSNGIMFPARISGQDNFIAILQFVDWLFYSEKGNEFTRWGIEGDTFAWDKETGRRTFLEPYSFMGIGTGAKDVRLEAGYGNGLFDVGQSAEQNFSWMDEEEVSYQEAMNAERTVIQPDPAAPLLASEVEQIALINNSVKDAVSTAIMEFISGRRPLTDSEWEAFKAQMQSLNYQQVVDIMNNARDRYLKNHQ